MIVLNAWQYLMTVIGWFLILGSICNIYEDFILPEDSRIHLKISDYPSQIIAIAYAIIILFGLILVKLAII